jgi:parallel beta-helix repeat protein
MMKRLALFPVPFQAVLVWSMLFMQNGFADTSITAGEVSGSWTAVNSPYLIEGEINVPDGLTLSIEPGVRVIFQGYYKLNVQGRLLSIGTQQDTIIFTAEDIAVGWHGIRFINTPNTNDSSKIVYCLFKNGKANIGVDNGPDRCGGAIYISGFDKVLISDCYFDSNMTSGERHTTGGAGIYIEYASPIITNNTFTNNSGTADGGIACAYKSEAIISKNILKNNSYRYGAILCAYTKDNKPTVAGNIIYNNTASERAGGIFIAMDSNPLIINNIIIYNHAGEVGGGIGFGHSGRGVFSNNTIAFNSAGNSGGGIDCYDNCDPIFINNIIYDNSANTGDQVSIYDSQSDPDFLYCNIQGGKDEFSGDGAGNNYTGIYENNIDANPLFADVLNNDFHLLDSSPCISYGTDSVEVYLTWYYAPTYDMEGNSRPNPSGTAPDIGACESHIGHAYIPPTGIKNLKMVPLEFQLAQNYPNPFNPNTTIQYNLRYNAKVKLTVYDLLGREVKVLANAHQSAGAYQVLFNGEQLAGGIYFYQIQVQSDNGYRYHDMKKLILIK